MSSADHPVARPVGDAWHRFWFAPASLVRLGIWRALVCSLALHDVMLMRGILRHDAAQFAGAQGARSWNPIYLFDLLGIQPLSPFGVEVLLVVAVASLGFGACGLFARTSCAVGAVVFFLEAGLVYSFGKPHHDKVALAFALAVLPLAPVGARVSLDAIRLAARDSGPLPSLSEWAGWPIRVAQVAVATGYCLAGSSKLWMAGLDWFNGYSLQGILVGHDNHFARLVAGNLLACRVQAVGLVATQALFPLVFVLPRLRWVFLPLAVSFHLVTWATMDTGPYMRLWLLVAAFLPLEQVPVTLRRWIREAGGFRALAAVVLTLGVTGLVVRVVAFSVPWWGLGLGFGPLLVAAALYLTDLGRGVFRYDSASPAQVRAVAWLRGLDWSKRLVFVDEPDVGVPRLELADGRSSSGRWAVRVAARRTLAAPCARWLARGLPDE